MRHAAVCANILKTKIRKKTKKQNPTNLYSVLIKSSGGNLLKHGPVLAAKDSGSFLSNRRIFVNVVACNNNIQAEIL